MIDASIEAVPAYGDYAIESRLFLTERGKLTGTPASVITVTYFVIICPNRTPQR
jgi:hypothetical protein